MMGRRQRLVCGDEWDVISYRKWYCWTEHAGAVRKIKQQMNRRARKQAKADLRNESIARNVRC